MATEQVPRHSQSSSDCAAIEKKAQKPGGHAQREARRKSPRKFLSPWMRRLLALREKTVFERSELLVASDERSRLDLSPEHALALLEKSPVLFREAWVVPTNIASRFACGGFEIGDGWFHIVDRLSTKLTEDTALHVVQLKEKYGRLKVYFERDESVPPDTRLDAEMETALDEAADESERTCEVCGEPGTSEERNRWVSVRCEPCLQIEEKARRP